ncbi:probable serine/threonine-protein kinase irlB [Mercenaria mercenaria]|uniref:probable serine/threonine-protein kinase irlB n=1 Tax=Mercenaria mercenaria TaxID=6596 RepID=UPI00234E8EFF|nr:probable serine/threonine-protein kinase irlB [Mercenaria mercenaria]
MNMADESDSGTRRRELEKLAEITSGCQKIYEDALAALKEGNILPLCAQPLLQQHLEPVNNMSVIKMVETRVKQMEKREVAVLVMGEFNAGKSTFMNILMGGQYLPMDRGKVTHVVCEIRYSSLRMAILKFEDKGDDKMIMLQEDSTDVNWVELRKYIRTKVYSSDDEAERTVGRKVERIIIYWPLKVLEGLLDDTNERHVKDITRREPDGRSRTSSDFPQEFLDRLRKPHASSFNTSDQAEARDPDQTDRKEVATSKDETSFQSNETEGPQLHKSKPIAIEVLTQDNAGINVPTGASVERTSESAPASYQSNHEHNAAGNCHTDRQGNKEHEYTSDAEEQNNDAGTDHKHRQRSNDNGHPSEADDDTNQTYVKQRHQQDSADQNIQEAAGNENISSVEGEATSQIPAFQFVFFDCPGIDLQDNEKDSPEYTGMIGEVARSQSFIFILDTNKDTGIKKRGVKALMHDVEKVFKRRNMDLNPDLSLFVANKADVVMGDREASEKLMEEVLQKLTETWPLTRKEHVLLFQANKELRDHVEDTKRKHQIQDFLLQTMRITLEEHCIWLLRMLEIAHTLAKLGQESSPVVYKLDNLLKTTKEEAMVLQGDVRELSDVDVRRKAWNELRDVLLRNEKGLQKIQFDLNEINTRIPNAEIDWGELSGIIHTLIAEKVEREVTSATTKLRQQHEKELGKIYKDIEERMGKLQSGISGLEEMKRDEANLRNGIYALLMPVVLSAGIRALPAINPLIFMAAPIIPLGLFGKFVVEDIQGAVNEAKRRKFKAKEIEFMKGETKRILDISKKELKGKSELPESPLYTYFFGESKKKVIIDQTEKVIQVIELLQEMTCHKSEPSQKCSKRFITTMMKFYVESVMKHEFTEKDDINWVFNNENIRCTIDQGRNACTYEAKLSNRFEFKKPVAVKEFRCKLEPSDRSIDLPTEVDAYRECFYLRQLSTKRHDKLVNFLGTGTSVTDGYLNLRIVMERYIGDLKRHVISTPRSPSDPKHWKEFLHYAKECTEGLKFIHENNVIHRDVKPTNYLIKNGVSAGLYSVVISDVGCAKFEEVSCTRGQERGTPAYWAPEISAANTFHSKASDVFSLGLVLWEVWVRQLSYDDNGRKRNLLKVIEAEKIPVVKNCLKTDPRSRITSADLLAELRIIQN